MAINAEQHLTDCLSFLLLWARSPIIPVPNSLVGQILLASFRTVYELQSSGGSFVLNDAKIMDPIHQAHFPQPLYFFAQHLLGYLRPFPFSQCWLSFFRDSKSSSLPTLPWVLVKSYLPREYRKSMNPSLYILTILAPWMKIFKIQS